uniref:Uncharacterized protein n=1 Tax=viral metagenome TaxID=1070528 RepID=A0A6C0CFH4_9ZZZZ
MRLYKLLLLLNLFTNVNPFMIRPSTSNHNNFLAISSIQKNINKPIFYQSQLNIRSSIISNKCKEKEKDDKLIYFELFLNTYNFIMVIYIVLKYGFLFN